MKNMSYEELYNTDITSLTDKQLENYINKLKRYRVEKTRCHDLSANECGILLIIASAEKSSRASSYLAKVSILIAVSGIILSLLITIIGK